MSDGTEALGRGQVTRPVPAPEVVILPGPGAIKWACDRAHARYLGADAALTAATSFVMSESDARSVLSDVDPAVLDSFTVPNLSGEYAGDPTPRSLAGYVLGDCSDYYACTSCDDFLDELVSELVDAWEQGRDEVWDRALQAVALRVLGRVADACELERSLEATAAALRREAGQ